MQEGRIRVGICGRQKDLSGGESGDVIVQRAAGRFERRGMSYLLHYQTEPDAEGNAEATSLLVSRAKATLRRKGAVESVFTYTPGKKEEGFYQTPYGILSFDIETEQLLVEEGENFLLIVIRYRLGADGSELTAHELEIRAVRTDTN